MLEVRKTPDEIKKGLEITSNDCLMCECCVTDCPYDLECHPGNEETNTNVPKAMLCDALALIQQLQAERDAAVEDLETVCVMFSVCHACKDRFFGGERCRGCLSSNHWEWRGVQKEDSDA